MDLSFARFDQNSHVTALPSDLAVMLVGVAARQAASPTAMVQVHVERPRLSDSLFAPLHGAFNLAVAALLTTRKVE